ncbi:sigma-70 family RNA polymerase sigma factor [uncultured Ruminococcus sp.]|uniref:sigma-70 family RNA polymerase sigma factor n=1 Tax=uncultured Ruminococcus sp. TaxID=165186 RepID=UPI00261EEE64|nr:sigma-70 family RNA polymerase sigma factor [uncultured Ruminococcus sp.]
MSFRSQKKRADQIYMGEPIETDGDGNQLTLMDIIDDGTDLPELVDTLIQSKQLYQYLKQCLEPREIEILVHRYGLYGRAPMTQREVAKKLDISRSYVSRLEKHAIEKLRRQYHTPQ